VSLLTIDATSRTHVGLVRHRNEDAAYVGRYLFAVADGLGGHTSGDIASTTVIDTLSAYDRYTDPGDLADALGQAIHHANQALRRRIERELALAGMSTTLVAMLWSGTSAVVANLGDSRAYLLREGKLLQLTEDHTYGNLVAAAANVPHLSEKIARFLDGRADGRSPDLTLHDLNSNDRVLLCSDGLSGVVPVEALQGALNAFDDPGEAADRLVELALEGGGPDNVTVVVVDVQDVRQD
jgi:serine/threonine protein phosphatase PrpC